MPLLNLPDCVTYCDSLRAQGRRLVFTNGVFDLLHVGHVDYLEKARALGQALVVGVNGDGSAGRLKGAGRPFVPAVERARLLAALRCVDAVTVFDDLTAGPLLQALRPNVYVKGGDYANKPLPEAEAARAVGAEIVLIDYLPGYATTGLIEKIAARARTNPKELK